MNGHLTTLASFEAFAKETKLFLLAQAIATSTPGFFQIKGPGIGDKASHAFMLHLRREATKLFGEDFSERRACGRAKFALDFYFPDEKTAVEVALSLRNPSSEYERDIFKCLLAMEDGCPIRQLVFITKPGGHINIIQRSGATAIRAWVEKKFGLEIEVRELQDQFVDPKAAVEHLADWQTSNRRQW
jgi:hypothetical protein